MDNVEGTYHHGTDRSKTDHMTVWTYTAIIFAGLLAGCTVGPDFKRPAAPNTPAYTATPLSTQTATAATAFGGAQHFRIGSNVSAQWWRWDFPNSTR